MHTSSKISQAKAKLLVEYPLFGTIASKLKLIQNNDIQAFKSDGIKLEYNSDFFNNITSSKIEFILANGAMHASLVHQERKNNRSGWLWQMATDFAINDILVENGMDCPTEAHYSKRFSGMYAEEIYAELADDILRDELEYETDDIDDINNEESQNQKLKNENLSIDESYNEQLFDEFASSVIKFELNNNETPSGLDRLFNLDKSSKVDWRDELRVALEKFHKDDFTLMPPSKKFLHLGIYLPSVVSQRFKMVVAIDSSGSVDELLLGDFLSELDFLMNTIPNYEIELLVCDEKIRTHKTFYSGDKLEVDLKGGGATDFRPVFEFIKNELQDINLLLYFTDLAGIFPVDAPNYVVKWISPLNKDVLFGEIILLDT